MPDPILISISAALAAKAAVGLYDLVKRKFAKEPAADAALEAAVTTPSAPGVVQVLAERLGLAERDDPEFSARLRAEWAKVSTAQKAEDAKVINQISGDVGGKVLQAGDIHGNVTF
ncbi:hypothetical protein [Amycolatopsis alba]|uniref:Uncharacterized protein n=1 Tax=Amycolatopsis alba DSM 44262 TaxID=1125972 RepID=A0A229RSM5_AMYAL|nr:hypothetical protein [Amycolatopsis alba]OXM49662.1 hypothetical protein CFP75_17990 [Amycolatopsis alba DSM 44262]